jgi:bla regulator protein blaR1
LKGAAVDTVLQIGLSNAVVASALALIAVLVGYFYRRPALIHGLWLLVLLKLLTPPLVLIPVAWPAPSTPELRADSLSPMATADPSLAQTDTIEPQPENSAAPALFVQVDSAPEQPEPPPATIPPVAAPPWRMIVATVWLAGSAGWFLLAGWRVWRFRCLLRFALPAPPALRQRVERLAHRMKLRACPSVHLVPGRLAPMLWTMGGPPRLLLPKELLSRLTVEQQETLLVHELAHLRRRDHWVRGLEFLAMGLYWWHPVVWYARRELREAEEQCCDAWVVSLLPGAGKTYATALLETLDFLSDARSATPLLASGVGHVSDLKRRLTMIMSGTTPRSLTWRGMVAVTALGLFALPFLPTLVNAQTQEAQQAFRLILDETQAEDANKAQAELERARAELAKAQAELKLKQAQVQALEARLAAMKGDKVDPRQLKIQRLEHGDVPEEIALRIDGQHLRRHVQAAEHGDVPMDIVLRKVGDKWVVVQAVPPQPQRPGAGPNAPPPSPEGRLENLEQQLKQIMQELESLRKEMKQPRPGTSLPGRTTVDPKQNDEIELKKLLDRIEVEKQKKD